MTRRLWNKLLSIAKFLPVLVSHLTEAKGFIYRFINEEGMKVVEQHHIPGCTALVVGRSLEGIPLKVWQ